MVFKDCTFLEVKRLLHIINYTSPNNKRSIDWIICQNRDVKIKREHVNKIHYVQRELQKTILQLPHMSENIKRMWIQWLISFYNLSETRTTSKLYTFIIRYLLFLTVIKIDGWLHLWNLHLSIQSNLIWNVLRVNLILITLVGMNIKTIIFINI